MKKFISVLSIIVMLVSALSLNCFAEANEAVEAVPYEMAVADEFDRNATVAYGINNFEAETRASGLIAGIYLKLEKKNGNLVITASTTGASGVTKCGFTYIRLQRWLEGKWQNYTTYCYTDKYSDSAYYSFSKTFAPSKGYTYRVICEHYAEKKKLLILKDKETLYNQSTTVYF